MLIIFYFQYFPIDKIYQNMLTIFYFQYFPMDKIYQNIKHFLLSVFPDGQADVHTGDREFWVRHTKNFKFKNLKFKNFKFISKNSTKVHHVRPQVPLGGWTQVCAGKSSFPSLDSTVDLAKSYIKFI